MIKVSPSFDKCQLAASERKSRAPGFRPGYGDFFQAEHSWIDIVLTDFDHDPDGNWNLYEVKKEDLHLRTILSPT